MRTLYEEGYLNGGATFSNFDPGMMIRVCALSARRYGADGVLELALTTTTVLAFRRFHTTPMGSCLPSGVMMLLFVASIFVSLLSATFSYPVTVFVTCCPFTISTNSFCTGTVR